jgi:eukaryotic-like serine/threonine-protein kinase
MVGLDDQNAPVRAGDVVSGKYRVERMIGSGGMGFVVAARHLALDEPVALKFLLSHQSENREVVERLMREARATFRLRSIHSVRVHDVGELPEGHLYIVMELLEGRDLRAELDARGALPVSEVVSHALDACEALQEAHALGIVHRDLKPGNLFLTRSPQGRSIVKVLDFGMSKGDFGVSDNGPLTLPETALGTPRYMAPEQWKSASSVDLTADIWALGIVLYELLTGKTPLHRMQLAERQTRFLAGAIPSPREARPDVPEELARVVLRCLRGDPRARWGSAAHLSRALRAGFPDEGGDAAEITRTGVTAVVPPEVQAKRAARAFETAPSSAVPSSAALTPAMPRSPFQPAEDFEAHTEVRPPMFTPGDYVAQSGEIPSTKPPKAMGATLRSFEGQAPLVEIDPRDQTLRIPGAPLHPAPAKPSGTTSPLGIASRPAPPPAPAAPVPVTPVPRAWVPSPMASPPLPPRPARSNVAVYVALIGVAALIASAVVAWLVLRSR